MDDTLITTTELEDVQEQKTGDSTEYTADQQQLDQEKANSRRAREELSSVTAQLESANERTSSLEADIVELKRSNEEQTTRLEAEQKAEQSKLADMDPELVDPQVIENIKRIESSLASQREDFQKEKAVLLTKISELSDKATQNENERAETAHQKEQQKAVDSVLTRVEDSLKAHAVTTPGQFRTEAIKMADDLVDKGERSRPGSIIDGIELMEECYLKVISQHKTKKGVSVDGGKSGVTTGVKSTDRKTGSLDDVADDMLKDQSWKED